MYTIYMSKVLKNNIMKTLEKLNVGQKTLDSFNIEIDKIIKSNYQMINRLNMLKSSINENNNTLTKVRAVIASNKKEVKSTKNIIMRHTKNKIDDHLSNVPTSFKNEPKNNAKNALSKALTLIKGNFHVKEIKVYYKRKGIVAINLIKKMTRLEIKELGDKLSQNFKKYNIKGEIGIAILYKNMWAPALFVHYGQTVRLWSSDDSDSYDEQPHYEQIEIYLSEGSAAVMGEGEYNDCLYKCLWFYLHDNIPWKCDYTMKKALGIDNRYEKVNIKHIPRLEKLLNVSINITGDYIFTSTLNKNLIIDLILTNEHCTINYKKIDEKIKRISNTEKKPMLYDEMTFLGYDGQTTRIISKEERNNMFMLKSDYILIRGDSDKCLIEQYNIFIQNADLLKHESNLINLYKTGNIDRTALYLFDRFTKHIRTPPNIYQAEAEFISNAKQGALIFAEPYQGEAYKFDIVSSYPSIMNSSFLFPIKEGEFRNIT